MKSQETIRLQSVGHVPAIPASEMREGDVRMYNFGHTSLVIKIIEKTDKTLTVITYDLQNKKYYMDDIRKTTLVAIVKRDQDISAHKPKEAYNVAGRNKGIVDVSKYFQVDEHATEQQQKQQTEITGTIDDNGLIILTNEQATELEKRFVYDKATKQEQELLKQYHLQLQEQAMKYAQTLPSNYEELIDDDKIYQVVSCFPFDGGTAGVYEIEVTGSDLKHMLWRKVDILNIVTPLEVEQQPEQTIGEQGVDQTTESEVTQEQDNSEITVNLNDELNGIEIRFPEKPAQKIIDQLKINGFRWSKRGFWYAKQSEMTLTFARSLTSEQSDNNRQEGEREVTTYPEIQIDDLEQYTVSDELQRRLHSSSMFEVDYKRDCQLTFQQFQNEALQVLALTDDPRLQYYIKKYLQSFKKRYYEQYLKILNHKASNPSWIVTGRGGLNVSRYNKMQERYDRYIGESVKLSKEFEKKMQDFKWQIQDQKDKEWREKMNNSLNNTDLLDVFIVERKSVTVAGYTEKVRTYNYNGYTIAKTCGMFRIFNNGKEIKTTLKTTDTLTTAKRYVLMLCQQEQVTA